jgi:eukaryotic-like serine/threonine-protein kinase
MPSGKEIPVREVVDIAKQLAEAVVTLHSKARIAHFDIKPDNVLLDAEGNCYLCDFSIAKEIPSHARAIMLPHDAYGSTEYMAPEQVGVSMSVAVYAARSCVLVVRH